MNKRRKLNEKEIIPFLPDLVMFTIFTFLDNETLWLNIPLTCNRFKKILELNIKLIARDCNICSEIYDDHIEEIKDKIFLVKEDVIFILSKKERTMSNQELIVYFEKKIKEEERDYKLRISSGLKKVYDDEHQELNFCCSECRDKCHHCDRWTSTDESCSICITPTCFMYSRICQGCDSRVCINHMNGYDQLCSYCYKK